MIICSLLNTISTTQLIKTNGYKMLSRCLLYSFFYGIPNLIQNNIEEKNIAYVNLLRKLSN